MAEHPDELAQALSGRYTVERELGRGGMATVYLGHDLKHDRPVALKVLDPHLGTPGVADRFLREIRLTARMDHPHIVPVFDSGEDGGRLWYAMPYVEGETLRERLQRDGPLPLEEALRLTREVADALDCAHAQGIVHRDVKPENILLARGHARVADFGVAHALASTGSGRITETGVAVGTPSYMSPEQALGDTVDRRTDVYALGCVLYEMLAGEPPHTGPTAQAIIAKRLTGEVPRLGVVREVPPAVESAVGRALARSSADRFDGPGDLARALDAPAAATPARSRSRAWVVPALVLAAAAVAGYAILASGGRGAVPAADTGYRASIAILPFAAVGDDSTGDYFSEGMTDEIITQLAQVSGLKVISRISVVALKNRSLTLPQIAETLGVRHVMEGTIRRTGDSVRVNVQLVDARNDTHLWAESYDRPLAAVFGLQDEIAREVSRRVLGEAEGPRPRASSSRTEETRAYDAYLEGKYWVQRRTPEGFARAVELLKRAIREDSSFAPAYAALASVYSLCTAHQGCPPSGDPDSIAVRALALGERAVALDPDLAEAYAARGYAAVALFGMPEVGLKDLERAIALRPSSGEIQVWYGVALSSAGRIAEGLRASRTAAALDPIAPGVRTGLAASEIIARDYEAGIAESHRAFLMEPGLLTPVRWHALSLILSGRGRECTGDRFRRAAALWAACLHAAGRREEAARVVDSLERGWRPATYWLGTDIAKYYGLAGDAPAAARWWELSRGIQGYFLPSAVFDPVRHVPVFREAVERLRQRDEAAYRAVRERAGRR